ncbi:hypothetical protein ACFE04_021914 [Oxalis oulophora]
MVEAKLPPGFRFHPRDDELVCDYLMKKTHSSVDHQSLLFIEVDLNKSEPWDIPDSACVGGKDWYFYSQRDRKYATGQRTNRATATGYWKATGKDRHILRKGTLVGMRKTLVFYQGRAPKGRKTNWVMHEFRLQLTNPSSAKEDWVLCRAFNKEKEVSAKSTTGSYNDQMTSSINSYLPPLMDSTFIAFDQNTPNSLLEQVSCFSSFTSQNQYIINPIFTHLEPNNSTKHNEASIIGQVSSSSSSVCLCPLNNCDKGSVVADAVLNHFAKIETNIDNFDMMKGEGSSESYLSEVGRPNIWTNYYK